MTKTYMIAHGSAAVQASRIIAAVDAEKRKRAEDSDSRPIVAEQQGGGDVAMLEKVGGAIFSWQRGYTTTQQTVAAIRAALANRPTAAP